jgi:hypothetical protein
VWRRRLGGGRERRRPRGGGGRVLGFERESSFIRTRHEVGIIKHFPFYFLVSLHHCEGAYTNNYLIYSKIFFIYNRFKISSYFEVSIIFNNLGILYPLI